MGGVELPHLQKVLHRKKKGGQLHTKISNEKSFLHRWLIDKVKGYHRVHEDIGGSEFTQRFEGINPGTKAKIDKNIFEI